MASVTMRGDLGMGPRAEPGSSRSGDTAQGAAEAAPPRRPDPEYVQNRPALMTEKLVRQEGWITLWDLPDVQITIRRGRDLGYVFPASGTPAIDETP